MRFVFYVCFLSLFLVMFLIKWFVTLNIYPVETVDNFFRRICTQSPNLVKFLDPIRQIRDCRVDGKIVDSLQDDEYWDEGSATKFKHASIMNRPFEDPNSKRHFLVCPSFKPPFGLKCPGDLVFDKYEEDCIYENSCFGKQKGDKLAFNSKDFGYHYPNDKLPNTELIYFICDGKNKIDGYKFCNSNQFFEPNVVKDCVADDDSCRGKQDGTVHSDKVRIKGIYVQPDDFKYFVCVNQESNPKICPMNQFFNRDKNQCQKTDRCKGKRDKLLFKHPSEDRMYYECVSQEEIVRICPEQTLFDGTECA